jgi:hypothetical protein
MVLLDIMTSADVELLSTTIGHLFPVMPVAMDALRGFFVGNLNEVVLWLFEHATDPLVIERTATLRRAQETVAAAHPTMRRLV